MASPTPPFVPRPQLLGRGVLWVGPDQPQVPSVGDMWWRTDPDGTLYMFYDDGDSQQWVTASTGAGALVGSGPRWIQFPVPPLTVGQEFTATSGVTYTWDGLVWAATHGTGDAFLWTTDSAVIVGMPAPVITPADPTQGLLLPPGKSLFLWGNATTPAWIVNAATGNPWLVMGRNDKLGVGGPLTGDPVETLDVHGGIRLGVATDTNPATLPGTIQYVSGQFQVYTASGWTNVISAPPGGGPVVFPGPIVIDGAGATAPVAGELIWDGVHFLGYDGTTWRTLDSPWGPVPAGGDLAGNYPNPTIPSLPWSKITGAPAIPAVPITRPNIAPNAPCGTPVIVTIPTTTGPWTGPLGWTTVASLSITTRGGSVFLFASPSIAGEGIANLSLRWFINGVRQVTAVSYLVSAGTYAALGTLSWVDTPPAGANTYEFQIALDANCAAHMSNIAGGAIIAMEVG